MIHVLRSQGTLAGSVRLLMQYLISGRRVALHTKYTLCQVFCQKRYVFIIAETDIVMREH
ncbi:hypothetical protein CR161_08665 [Prosthecochloris sp. ZM]|nr:hypothetical protein CR161_08665 [Prosthecochloris sp. ZM]